MDKDRSTDTPKANAPLTEAQILAVTVGERKPWNSTVYLAPYDPAWQSLFTRLEAQVRKALGDDVLLLEHVGSTSVPGLSAKPIIDMVLAVADSSDEPSYVPRLEAEGYTLRIREPDWFEHRMLKPPDKKAHLHVFSEGCAEIEQMLLFRDWLRHHADDRLRYEETKRELAARTWKYRQNYADAKTQVIQEILARARRNQI
ncbi:MAG: GrpB family protein [Chloroflexi bacterium]|nr:GrpB family protein [Chloroflexota bacterium]